MKELKRFQVYKLHEYTFENPSVFLGFSWSLWQQTKNICESGPGQWPRVSQSGVSHQSMQYVEKEEDQTGYHGT